MRYRAMFKRREQGQCVYGVYDVSKDRWTSIESFSFFVTQDDARHMNQDAIDYARDWFHKEE